VGQTRLELVTPSLSEKCSNRLSYWPTKKGRSEMGRTAEAAVPRSDAPPEGESLRDKSVRRV
jgi:hypothetical protein